MADPTWDETAPIQAAPTDEAPKWDDTVPADAPPQNPGSSSIVDYLEKNVPGWFKAGNAGFLNAGMGLGPTIGAIGNTAMDAITGVNGPLAGGSIQDLIDEYHQKHQQIQNEFARAAAAHPLVSAAGNIAGGAATLAPFGAAAATPAGLGAAGATAGFLNSPDIHSGTDLGNAVANAAKSAGTSMLAGAGINTVAKGIAAAPGWLGDKAEDLAVKAIGATAKEAQYFADDTGRQLLDRGIVKFGSSPGDIAANANATMDESGEGIMNTLQALEDKGVTVDRNTVLNYIRSKIRALSGDESQADLARSLRSKMGDIQEQIDASTKSVPVTPPKTINAELPPAFSEGNPTGMNAGRQAQIQSDIAKTNLSIANDAGFNPYADLPEVTKPVPISQAENIKRGYQSKVNWKSPNPDIVANNANTTVSDAYRQAVEDAATQADPSLAAQFKADKETYGLLSPVRDAAERRAGVLNQNPIGGLHDVALAGVGGAPAVVAKRVAFPRAASALAVSADKLSQVLSSTPSAFGKFAGVLQSAAARGSTSLNATDYLLQQTNQDYREQRDRVFNPSENEEDLAPLINRRPDQNGP